MTTDFSAAQDLLTLAFELVAFPSIALLTAAFLAFVQQPLPARPKPQPEPAPAPAPAKLGSDQPVDPDPDFDIVGPEDAAALAVFSDRHDPEATPAQQLPTPAVSPAPVRVGSRAPRRRRKARGFGSKAVVGG